MVLKMRFQVFSLASKRVQGFSSDRNILILLLSVLFHCTKNEVFHWIFSKCDQIWSKLQIWSHLLKKSLMGNLIFYAMFYVQNRVSVFWNFNFYSRHLGKRSLYPRFCRRRTAEDNKPKINVSWVYLVTFCSSKLVHFFKCSFREIYFSDKFWERQFFSIVNVWHF